MKHLSFSKHLTAEKAQKILLEDGTIVSLEEAKLILDFLKILAKIVVKNYLKKHENSRFIHTGKH